MCDHTAGGILGHGCLGTEHGSALFGEYGQQRRVTGVLPQAHRSLTDPLLQFAAKGVLLRQHDLLGLPANPG